MILSERGKKARDKYLNYTIQMTPLTTQVFNYEKRMYLIEMFTINNYTKNNPMPIEKMADEIYKRMVGVYGTKIREGEEIDWKERFKKDIKTCFLQFKRGDLFPMPFPETQRPRCMFCSEKWSFWWWNKYRVREIVKNKGDMCEGCQEQLTNECIYCDTKLNLDWKTKEKFKCDYCGQTNYRWFFCSTCIKQVAENVRNPLNNKKSELTCEKLNITKCKFYKSIEPELKRSRTIPKDVQRDVWRRDGGRCVECGSKERLEYDHIIPFSKGGSNTVRNIQLLCEGCNRKKSNII